RDRRTRGRGNRNRRGTLPPALCEGRFDQDHRADRVRSGARRRRIRVGGGARNGEVPRDRRRQYRQYLQPRGGGDLRGRDAGRREAVRAAPQRSEAPRVQARRRGVPPWTWPELGAQVRDLDALYVNFISGYEMDLQTAQLLRRGFPRFLYADLHSLFLGKEPDGTRVPQPLPDAPAWFSCFDVVQLNEEELAQLGPDPLIVAAGALARGCQTLVVTLGPRGAAYFTGRPVRSARIASDPAPDSEGDPTGCGDVLGATV